MASYGPGYGQQPIRPTSEQDGPICTNPTSCCTVITGSVLILCGLASLGVGITVAIVYVPFHIFVLALGYSYAPIWAGLVVLFAGVSGALTACCFGSQKGIKCALIAFLVMTILAILSSGLQINGELTWAAQICQEPGSACKIDGVYIWVAHVSLSIIGGIAAITALIGSFLACIGLCSNNNSGGQQNDTTVFVQAGSAQPAQQQSGGYPMTTYSGPPPAYGGGGYPNATPPACGERGYPNATFSGPPAYGGGNTTYSRPPAAYGSGQKPYMSVY